MIRRRGIDAELHAQRTSRWQALAAALRSGKTCTVAAADALELLVDASSLDLLPDRCGCPSRARSRRRRRRWRPARPPARFGDVEAHRHLRDEPVAAPGPVRTPRIESSGPHIPASVSAAVPPASTRSSAVCTCVWLPIDGRHPPVEEPSHPDLLGASPRRACRRRSPRVCLANLRRASRPRRGTGSRPAPMKTRPIRFSDPDRRRRRCAGAPPIPLPGDARREVDRPEHASVLLAGTE